MCSDFSLKKREEDEQAILIPPQGSQAVHDTNLQPKKIGHREMTIRLLEGGNYDPCQKQMQRAAKHRTGRDLRP